VPAKVEESEKVVSQPEWSRGEKRRKANLIDFDGVCFVRPKLRGPVLRANIKN
jgi:hypothetical protein